MATSPPRPSVSRRISDHRIGTGEIDHVIRAHAPGHLHARGHALTAMMVVAPISRAPAVAHRPMGP